VPVTGRNRGEVGSRSWCAPGVGGLRDTFRASSWRQVPTRSPRRRFWCPGELGDRDGGDDGADAGGELDGGVRVRVRERRLPRAGPAGGGDAGDVLIPLHVILISLYQMVASLGIGLHEVLGVDVAEGAPCSVALQDMDAEAQLVGSFGDEARRARGELLEEDEGVVVGRELRGSREGKRLVEEGDDEDSLGVVVLPDVPEAYSAE